MAVPDIQKAITTTYKDGQVVISNVRNNFTNENFTFSKTDIWYDGTPMDDSKCDGVIYRKLGDEYFVDSSFISNKSISVNRFGVNTEDITDRLQKAIDILNRIGGGELIVPEGNYTVSQTLYIKEGVFIKGNGRVNLNSILGVNVVFDSEEIVYKTFNQTSDVAKGDLSISTATTDIQVGDLITLKSNRRFTEEWDNGTAIRNYYLDGEIVKVTEVQSGSVSIEQPIYLNFPISLTRGNDFFTPKRHGGLDNINIVIQPSSNNTIGVRLEGWDGFNIGSLSISGSNVAGVQVNRCFNVNIQYLNLSGGTDSLGLNYGLSINDGSKYLYASTVTGRNFRHVVAGGGTGYAIPMYNTVDNITGKSISVHTADTHANTAFFKYGVINGENGFSISGVGHTVGSCKTIGSRLTPAYEGGIDLNFGDIQADNVTFFYTNNIVRNSRFGNVNLNFNFNLEGQKVIGFRAGSEGITFNSLRAINTSFQADQTSEINTSKLTGDCVYGMILRNNYRIKNLYVEGFPVAVSLQGSDIVIDELYTLNCGWRTTLLSENTHSCIDIRPTAQRSKISKATINISAGNTDLTNVAYVRGLPGASSVGLEIKNLKTIGGRALPLSAVLPVNYSQVVLENVRPVGTPDVQATGHFTYSTVIRDSSQDILRYTGNVDDIEGTGLYYIGTGSTNRPVDVNGYIIHQTATDDVKSQLFIPTGVSSVYVRTKDTTWGAWKKLQNIDSFSTADRPSQYVEVGQSIFDTDLLIPIWWNGTNWIDATGTIV